MVIVIILRHNHQSLSSFRHFFAMPAYDSDDSSYASTVSDDMLLADSDLEEILILWLLAEQERRDTDLLLLALLLS